MLRRIDELLERLRDARYAREQRRQVSPRRFPRLRRAGGGVFAGEGRLADARERVRPWHAIPALVALVALLAGGFWQGGAVGGHANAASLTKTLKVKGKIITVNGQRYVSTPALTVKIRGKIVHIPAKTVRVPSSTVISGKTVPVKVDVNHTVSVPVTVKVPTTRTQTSTTTINNTVVTTVITTVTQTQTVAGPTTTTFVTITLPATTVTVTVTS
jgi:hypothetical protein